MAAGLPGSRARSLLVFRLRIILPLKLVVDVAEKNMAPGGVRFQLLESRKGLDREPFVGLNRPVKSFGRMRLQCLKCSCRAKGALVVSGKE